MRKIKYLEDRSVHKLEPILKEYIERIPWDYEKSEADKLLIQALEAIVELKKLLWLECLDWADDHTRLEKLCLKHLPEEVVLGDSYGAPGISDLVDMLEKLIPQPVQRPKDDEDVFGECHCSDRFRIEAHGDGYALYRGRCIHRHGLNLAHITEADKATLDMIEGALNHGA